MKVIIVIALLIAINAQRPTVNKVAQWPGWPAHTFEVYSGFLEVGDDRNLHYVFVESQSANKATDPLVLWLNGGPGCSSMLGLLQEIGPFIVDNGETVFKKNEYAWNLNAHLLFLESPAGVGFSYGAAADYEYNDVNTAQDNYQAILKFISKFQEFKGRNFYISGESYAGIYIPYTAAAILAGEATKQEAQRIKLKGLLIGNGVLIADDDFRQKTAWKFMGHRSFYDPLTQMTLYHQCALNPSSVSCRLAKGEADKAETDINPYSVYAYCWQDSTDPQYKSVHKSRYPYTRWLSEEGDSGAPCLDFGPTQNHLNSIDPSVIHVNEITQQAIWKGWHACNDPISEKYKKNADKKGGSFALIPDIVKAGVDVLLYSGDWDLAVSLQETLDSIEKLQAKIIEKWTPLPIDGNDPATKGQLAGWLTKYDLFDLYVVRGAGHMVPQDQREAAYLMLMKYIH